MDKTLLKNQTACFTGHRDIKPAERMGIFLKTRQLVLDLVEKGVRFFGAGGAIGFDTIAAKVILDLKRDHPSIKLIIVCPCKGQDKYWNNEQKEEYASILKKADKVVYLSDKYYDGCMLARNRHLVDNSSYCISYCTKQTGGTAYTVEYAKEQGLTIVPVANCSIKI